MKEKQRATRKWPIYVMLEIKSIKYLGVCACMAEIGKEFHDGKVLTKKDCFQVLTEAAMYL